MSDDDELIFPPLKVERFRVVRADVAEARIADLKRQLSDTRAELAEARKALEPSDELIKQWVERLWQEIRTGSGWQPDMAEIIRAGFRCARAALAPVTESASEGGENENG